MRLPRRRPQPLLALPRQQGAGGRRVPQCKAAERDRPPTDDGARGRSTKCTIDEIPRSIAESGSSPDTGAFVILALRASRGRESGAHTRFRGFPRPWTLIRVDSPESNGASPASGQGPNCTSPARSANDPNDTASQRRRVFVVDTPIPLPRKGTQCSTSPSRC